MDLYVEAQAKLIAAGVFCSVNNGDFPGVIFSTPEQVEGLLRVVAERDASRSIKDGTTISPAMGKQQYVSAEPGRRKQNIEAHE